ncbi:MAG: hypothetical protein R3245_09860, partial [Kiloniellales bacterium]|nr:hypothetical protein [Kiloniellales bacterium]
WLAYRFDRCSFCQGQVKMLNLESLAFDYEPYPIGIARPAVPSDVYREMVRTFPTPDLFRDRSDKGSKFALSRHNNRGNYYRHIKNTEVWREFYAYIDSKRFIEETLDSLAAKRIDLGLRRRGTGTRMIERFRAIKKGAPMPHFPKLSARFEFSTMPVAGGSIKPHSDNPTKIITMVLSILEEGEWDETIGGGTSVVWPKDPSRSFNQVNAYLDFDDVEVLKTFPFQPNQCLCFIKTYNSWHAVWPMTGNDPSKLRKTLTINIESS